jgi:hypothetical protein
VRIPCARFGIFGIYSVNSCRTLACESTLGFDSPIWTLHASSDVDLNVFWIGCRDGTVVKTARKTARIACARVKTPLYEHEGLGANLSHTAIGSRASSIGKAPLRDNARLGGNLSNSAFSSRTSSLNHRRASVTMPRLNDVGDRFVAGGSYKTGSSRSRVLIVCWSPRKNTQSLEFVVYPNQTRFGSLRPVQM